jgi:dihydrofolate reductase
MKAIIAVNNLGYIGIGNKMLWNCHDDLQHFKKLTLNSSCLVGYNTYYGLPSLPNRTLMLDDRGHYRFDWDWCIGGKKTYEKYSKYFTELHISHIDNDSIGDVRFPDFKDLSLDCKIFNYHFCKNWIKKN